VGAFLATSPQRPSDEAIVFGKGLPEIEHDGACVAFVRSPHAHAHVRQIATQAAEEIEGVIAVITPDGTANTAILANGTVEWRGQPVAAVIARDPYIAADGIEAVSVEYEPLAPTSDLFDPPGRAAQFSIPVDDGRVRYRITTSTGTERSTIDDAFAAFDARRVGMTVRAGDLYRQRVKGAEVHEIELSLNADGLIDRIDDQVNVDIGATPGEPDNARFLDTLARCYRRGPYGVDDATFAVTLSTTNRAPVGAAAADDPASAVFARERALDAASTRAQLEPATVRRANLASSPERLRAWDALIERVDLADFRAEQQLLREREIYYGIGFACEAPAMEQLPNSARNRPEFICHAVTLEVDTATGRITPGTHKAVIIAAPPANPRLIALADHCAIVRSMMAVLDQSPGDQTGQADNPLAMISDAFWQAVGREHE